MDGPSRADSSRLLYCNRVDQASCSSKPQGIRHHRRKQVQSVPGTGRDDQRGGQQMSSMSTGSDHETGEVDIGSDCDDIELPPESQAVSSGNDQPITEVENNANLEPKTSANISDDGLHTADTNRVSDAAVNMDSPSDIASAPDSGPSLRGSPIPSVPGSVSSRRISGSIRSPVHRPFDLRFQSRISSSSSSLFRSSPNFFMSRTPSLASYTYSNASDTFESSSSPWEVVKWTKLRKITGHAFSELGKRNFGQPTCLAVSTSIIIGTHKGLILVFDYQQNLRHIIGQGTKAVQCGAVTSLAISADHTTIAAGHADGTIFTWEIARSARPFLTISSAPLAQAGVKGHNGHVLGASVIHIGFLGIRHTALVSADDRGMAFSHLATRGTGPIGRRVKTTRILGRYPDDLLIVGRKRKPSSVLAFSPLPLGNVGQATDSMGLVAMLTPYLLVIVSTTPVAETQYKIGRPKEMRAHSALTACLAWFPAIRLKGSNSETSRTKLVYCWSNVLTVLEVTEIPPDPSDPEKPPTLAFQPQNRWTANESIVAVQWVSRSVLAVLTITQQLLILEDKTLRVTDSFDLVNRQLYHVDSFSQQLHSLVEMLDEEDQSMHGVVADAFYMSFRSYKGRLFLLGVNDISVGSLSNWADRLYALMEASHFVAAIRLAKSYYVGNSEKLTVGLPEDDEARHDIVRDRLLEMMSASVRYVFGKNGGQSTAGFTKEQLKDLADACITACIVLNDRELLFNDLYEYYEENESASVFMDALEPYIVEGDIRALPPSAIKALVAHFSKVHSAEHLEEILCLLDTSTMDIDQVTSLCKSYNLYDAFIYVWTQTLKDYVGPLIELLNIIHQDENITEAESVKNTGNAMKIFPYMSYTLTGRIYPTGYELEEADALRAKTDVYRFLLAGDSGGTRFGNLRTILSFDSPSFFSMLNEAFEDNFLNETADQVGSANGPSDKFSINRQYIISILLEVMEPGSELDVLSTIYLDIFIARNLPKYPQYILLPGSALSGVLLRLCEYPLAEMLEDCQLSAECLLSIYHPPDIQVFIPYFKTAGFYRILKSVYRAEKHYPELIMTYFDDVEEKESVFTALRNCLRKSTTLTPKQRHEVMDVMISHATDLVAINVTETAHLVQEVAPDLHQRFTTSLDHDPRSQYLYLRTLFEPPERKYKTHKHLEQTLIEMYVKLMCTYDLQSVAGFINTLSETRNSLELDIDSVLSVMEDRGVVDAVVVLLARRGELRRAMDRLIEHLQTLKVGLAGLLEAPDDTRHEQIDLINSIGGYGRVGIWLCQKFDDSKMQPQPETKVLSVRDRNAALREPLNFNESLWLDLIETLVHIARYLTEKLRASGGYQDSNANMEKPLLTGQEQNNAVSPLHSLVQQTFTALLSLTSERSTVTKRTDLTFLRILRAFLTRAASTSPSLNELRSVLRDIFSAYTYEESLLSLANSMLDKDLFVHVDELVQLRPRGWRPKGRLCCVCRQRVWGPGAGEQIWEAWESKTKKSLKRDTAAGTSISPGKEFYVSSDAQDIKGKGRAVDSVSLPVGAGAAEAETSLRSAENVTATKVDPPDLDHNNPRKSSDNHTSALVIFACRHVYHRTCLLRKDTYDTGQDPDILISDRSIPICPRCSINQ